MERRTEYCGLLTEASVGQTVVANGWVNKRRDLGGLIFIHLRDREGIVQVVFNTEFSEEAFRIAETIRGEYVLQVKGKVVLREANQINPNIGTGTIEIEAESVEILAKAKTPPFYIEGDLNVSDELRMKYRYIDLRRDKMMNNMKIRHQTTRTVRNYLDDLNFMDIETPYLTKSTPEGARDYIVPSRVHQGEFYALPQSPQLFKQMLMGAGFDRYYQIVRCFRDEDLRGGQSEAAGRERRVSLPEISGSGRRGLFDGGGG